MFFIGQKVVCVDDTCHEPLLLWEKAIKEGEIYTIRWIGFYTHAFVGENLCVKLEEITRKHVTPKHSDAPFKATRFRPLVERKTSIEIFERILHGSPITEDTNA